MTDDWERGDGTTIVRIGSVSVERMVDQNVAGSVTDEKNVSGWIDGEKEKTNVNDMIHMMCVSDYCAYVVLFC